MGDRAASTRALFGPTFNEDGTLRAVSPSQIETFLACNLKWFFDKKEKLKRKDPSKGQITGGQAHDRIEHFWNTGEDIRGPLELMGAPMLAPYLWAAPFNKGPGVAEATLLNPRLSTPGGILITGFEDLHIPDPAGKWPTIIDHKFKKDLKKWAPDAAELLTDTQAVVYGAHALLKYPEAEGYIFRHHNHQTAGEGGRYAEPVEIRVPRAEGWERWLKLAEVVDGPMREAAKAAVVGGGKTPEGVAHDIKACESFGGCDFAKVCKFSPQNRFIAALRKPGQPVNDSVPATLSTKGYSMGLISQFQAASNVASVAPAPVPTPPAPPAASAAPAVMQAKDCKQGAIYQTFSGRAEFRGALGKRAFFLGGDGSNIELSLTDMVEEVVEQAAAKEVQARSVAGIVAVAETLGPAHAAEVGATLEAAPVLSPAKVEKARRMGIVDLSSEGNPVAPALAPTAAVVAPTPVAPAAMVAETTPPAPIVAVSVAEAIAAPVLPVATPAKRGRPTKAEVEARKASIPADSMEPAQIPAPVVAKAPKPADSMDSAEAPSLLLLVDCACAQAKDLTGYVQEVCKRVADEHGTPDVRLGNKNSDLGFGGWKAVIAIEALKNPPTGLCTISRSELADPIIEALAPMAKILVRGSGA